MPQGNAEILEHVASMLRHRRGSIADTTTRNNATLLYLRKHGCIKTIDGGRSITTDIMYGENANFMMYHDDDELKINRQEVITAAEFGWRQSACGVSMSGREILMNSGKNALINMMVQRTKNAEATIANQMHYSTYSDGSRWDGLDYGGLELLISTGSGATVGGINSGVSTWWDNKRTATGGVTTSTIYDVMLPMYLSLKRGKDGCDLIISDNTYYSVYDSSLQGQRRYMDSKMATAGFANVLFKEVPVVYDGGDGGYAPAGMFFLDCSEIELIMHQKRNNVVLEGPRRAVNSDTDTIVMASMGNFIIKDRQRQGRIFD